MTTDADEPRDNQPKQPEQPESGDGKKKRREFPKKTRRKRAALPEGFDAGSLFVELTQDLKKAARELTADQARYLVDTYYQVQRFRITGDHAASQAEKVHEPANMLVWIGQNMERLEAVIKGALDEYTDQYPESRWAKSIVGIGPTIAAGLKAHIDLREAKRPDGTPSHYVGSLYRFAGLDPSLPKLQKGVKRPWNASLKVLCFKLGESFVKVSGHRDDRYGKLYVTRKALEIERNARNEFREQAEQALVTKNFRKDTVAKEHYTKGELPPAHIHARAKRYAVKRFLSHYHHVLHELTYGEPPPKPWVLEHGGHHDYELPPNWNCQCRRQQEGQA
jgi:hypothetical protein